ncbi:MAG: hypothetical protein KIT31_02485 [Deltaproteobacteria bacterium]|nr:hypothetical protein [Deltaproteobacteria bacterium]
MSDATVIAAAPLAMASPGRHRRRGAAFAIAAMLVVQATSAQPAAAQPVQAAPPKVVGACPVRVELAGDGAAIAQVGAELGALGVELGGPVAGCRAIGARVELGEGGGIAVAIVDGARRSEGRVVGDAAVAAAWIDSWLRDDVDGTGWLVATPQPHPRPRAPEGGGPPGLVDPPVRVRRGTAVLDRVALGAAYEQSWTDDGASATGLTVAACVRAGGVCVGLRGRHAVEQDRSLETTAMSRSDTEVLAIATASFALGRMAVAPEVGVGVGWRDTARLECTPATPSPPPNCDPSDPTTCEPNGMVPPDGSMPGGGGKTPPLNGTPTVCEDTMNRWYVGDGLRARTFTPRLAAGVRVSVPLADRVWLEGSAGATLAPFGHTEAFVPSGAIDPSTNVTADQFALPGEPTLAFRLSVGLRVGAR